MPARRLPTPLLALCVLLFGAPPVRGQVANSPELTRRYAHQMLKQMHADLAKYYYDPDFNGLDMERALARVRENIDYVRSPAESFRILARFVMELNDSHSAFLPPVYADDIDYGFDIKFIGDTCFIMDVAPGTSAERGGLKPGDRVLRLHGDPFRRQDLAGWIYLNTVASPIQEVALSVQTGRAAPRRVVVQAAVRRGSTEARSWQVRRRMSIALDSLRDNLTHEYGTLGDSVLIWRMPSFSGADRAIGKLIEEAARHRVLVLDMRDNSGGAGNNMLKLVGAFFDRDVTLGTLHSRKKTEPMVAKAAKKPFLGRLILLVDSESASAAEVLARTIQLERRGTVIGDRTAGAVLASRIRSYEVGLDRVWYYGLVIPTAKLVMSDGQQLEGVGVTPDEVVLPTSTDIAAGRDPALARALELAGVLVSPEDAGRFGSSR